MSNNKQHITSIDDDVEEDQTEQFDNGTGTKSHAATAAQTKRSGKEPPSLSLPGASGVRKIITIHHGEGKIGASAAFVAVNGHAFHIPRGVKVSLPEEIVDALDNAVNIVYERVEKEMLPREVRRFPYSEHVK